MHHSPAGPAGPGRATPTPARPSRSGGRAWTTCRSRLPAALIWMPGQAGWTAKEWRTPAWSTRATRCLLGGRLPWSRQHPARAHLHGRV